SDYLAGYPLLAPTEGYRAFHLKHHRLLDTHEDPERITIDRFEREWTFPMPTRRFWWLLFRDMTGLWPRPALALMFLIWNIPARRVRHLIPVVIVHGTVAGLFLAAGQLWTLVLFWWLPLGTVFPACFRLRTAAEHSGIDPGTARYAQPQVDVVGTTRTTIGNPITRFFIAPH